CGPDAAGLEYLTPARARQARQGVVHHLAHGNLTPLARLRLLPPIPRGLPCPCSRSRSQRRRRSRGNRISPGRRSTGRVGSLLARRYTVGADTRRTSATSSTVRYSCPPSRTSVLLSGWLRAAVPAVRGIFPRSVSGMRAPFTWRPLSRVRARGPVRNPSST